ncbi:hypothetical protein [Salibacterium halotolerans]|uniref:Uncharacterized protein n=1 Tax=Salibacterium halotolerans TaxID=1884432 RepID=A0A1I5RN39_9BACI|nr:hypothetical protein [Salibacterium halotolerans]SFP59306.1 hypothetical protein SAMN05518683_10788 [Salibacterium halotolerans]
MNEEPEHLQHAMQKSPGYSVQNYFNLVLGMLSTADNVTSADLLRMMKQNWKLVAVDQFSDIYQYVITLPVMMDESLKLFSAFPLPGERFQEHVEDVLLTGSMHYKEKRAEAWMFIHGTRAHKQHLLSRAVHILEQKFPDISWTLTAADPLSAERFSRRKYMP